MTVEIKSGWRAILPAARALVLKVGPRARDDHLFDEDSEVAGGLGFDLFVWSATTATTNVGARPVACLGRRVHRSRPGVAALGPYNRGPASGLRQIFFVWLQGPEIGNRLWSVPLTPG